MKNSSSSLVVKRGNVTSEITGSTPVCSAYAVTGTFHGAIVYAKSEGEARRAFHKMYNGESITHITDKIAF